MSERLQHINPWAEKLSQVSLPEMELCWAAMEAKLDREMPKGWWKDWRRWLLLILVLLLLIGVCECPGRRWLAAGSPEGGATENGGKESGGMESRGKESGGMESRGKESGGMDSGGVESGGTKVGRTPVRGTGSTAGKPVGGSAGAIPDLAKQSPRTRGGKEASRTRTGEARVVKGKGVPGLDSGVARKPAGGVTRVSGADLVEARSGSQPGAPGGPEQVARQSKEVPATILPDSIRKKPAAKLPPALPDSAAKKKKQGKPADKQPEKEESKRNDGWLAAIGLNQFLSVGGQQASSYSSGGLSGALGDYIPIPMVRYYPQPDLYIQLEVQINTPQYTKKNLVATVSAPDSVSPVQTVQETVAINKLFYFNVPVSVHYTVFDHLDLGAGLQYSRLTNGIGVFNSNYTTSGVDSLASETKSFKGDSSVYKEIKTHEFRFLADANYNWRHFIFGLRYNQALSKFIHVEVSPGQVTQARNSSLQLYLRYILWDERKKKPSLPAK